LFLLTSRFNKRSGTCEHHYQFFDMTLVMVIL